MSGTSVARPGPRAGRRIFGRLDNPGTNGAGEADDESTPATEDEAESGAESGAENGAEAEAEDEDDDGFVEDYQLSRALDLLRGIRLFKDMAQ